MQTAEPLAGPGGDGAAATPYRLDVVAGALLALAAFVVFWLTCRGFDAGRGDFFWLADAFLRGRPWLEFALGPGDVIPVDPANYPADPRVHVPFAPFPAILLLPLVAVVGPETADRWEPVLNAALAATVVLLAWIAAGRIGVRRPADRLGLALLLGFSTQVWWVTTRGGVWHTGHLVAVILALLVVMELFGGRRTTRLGALVGCAFLTRAPLVMIGPALALLLVADARPALGAARGAAARIRALPWPGWAGLLAGVAPALALFLWYNAIRFASPFESGYQLALLAPWLDELRAKGLFAPVHVPMNVDLLLLKLPAPHPEFPWFRPDGLGMSVLFTSPGLLLAVLAPWRDPLARILLLAAGLALVPSLLYYGGGWLQYGYRYFLDSIPCIWALCAMGIARRGATPPWGWAALAFGLFVGVGGVHWAYRL